MRIYELEGTVRNALADLPYQRYLLAVGTALAELVAAYDPRNPEPGRALASRSITVLNSAIEGSEREYQLAANEVFADWLAVMGLSLDEDEEDEDVGQVDLPVEGGLANLWFSLRDVTGELAGHMPPYSALERLQLAMSMAENDGFGAEKLSLAKGQRVLDERDRGVILLRQALRVAEYLRSVPPDEVVMLGTLKTVMHDR